MRPEMSAAEIAGMSVLHPRFVREQRNLRILNMRQNGASLQKCADCFGLTRERVRQILSELQAGDCDHVLGLMGEDEYLLESLRESAGHAFLNANRRWLNQGAGSREAVAVAEAIDTPQKALAANVDFFEYCPRCGRKNDSL